MSESFDVWAVLELMGHVRIAGKVSEEERFGVKMGRIEIPNADGGFTTQYFGGEAEARAVAARSQPQPVHSWEMPRALPAHEPVGEVRDGLYHNETEAERFEREEEDDDS